MKEKEIIERPVYSHVDDLGRDRDLIHEAVMAGCKVGAGREFWAKLARDKGLFLDVVKLVMEAKKAESSSPIVESSAVIYSSTPSQVRAREIMGKNFLGIEEVVKHYKIVPTAEQLSALAEIPFSKEMIEEHKHGYLLVAGFPITILGIHTNVPSDKHKKIFYSDGGVVSWYSIQEFAKEKVPIGWYFIRKTAIKTSFCKKFRNQNESLGLNEEIPHVCELVYAVILYFLTTGGRLFGDVYVRCIGLNTDNIGVSVGDFTQQNGIAICNHLGDYPYDYVGISAVLRS